MLLLILIVHLSYFRKEPLSSGGWENEKGLAAFTSAVTSAFTSAVPLLLFRLLAGKHLVRH